MARLSAQYVTITPTATADAATTLANATYPYAIQGGSATQVNRIWEVSISGQAASSSSPTFMLLARDSAVGATPGTFPANIGTVAALDPATAALAAPVVVNNTWTTPPQRSATLKLLNMSLNAFGGVYFWRANRVEECPLLLGNTASFGEVSLSAYTGGTTGAIGCHTIFESE
jgi:hypothetical protein